MYYCGFLYSEVYSLPVTYKRWFIERIVKELNKGAPNRGLHANSPEVRHMQGMQREQTPSRLRRFT